MTDTPETDDLIARLRSFDYFGRSREEQDAAEALCREAATALEAAQERVETLEAANLILTGVANQMGKKIETTRREALEEAAKVVMARAFDDGMVDEYAEDIAAAIRALMENPNENG